MSWDEYEIEEGVRLLEVSDDDEEDEVDDTGEGVLALGGAGRGGDGGGDGMRGAGGMITGRGGVGGDSGVVIVFTSRVSILRGGVTGRGGGRGVGGGDGLLLGSGVPILRSKVVGNGRWKSSSGVTDRGVVMSLSDENSCPRTRREIHR